MTTTTGATETCFAALDLSTSKWAVAVISPHIEKVPTKMLPAFDVGALLRHLHALRNQAQEVLGKEVGITVGFETGYDGFWLQRLLTSEGIRAVVLDPASFLVDRRARRVKTDRVDAEAMAVMLQRWVRGDRSVFRTVRVPSVEEEDAKRLHRERRRLIGESTGHVTRIRALLALQGVRDINPKGKRAREKLAELRTADGRPFPPRLLQEIVRSFERLELVTRMIAEIDKEREAMFASDEPAFPCADKARLLARLRGVGTYSAELLTTEVFHREFTNRRHLASYLGLTPSPHASGEMERSQGISKAGNRPARSLAIELAWCWLRYQPQTQLAQWFRKYTYERPGVRKKIAIVALARKLVIALWRYLETGLIPSGAVLKVEA